MIPNELRDKQLEILEQVPRFDIEVSLACNIKCAMCPREKITRPKTIMSGELLELLSHWLPDGPCEVFFCGLGGPLLNPGIYGFPAKLRKIKRECTLGITTNGLLLNRERVDRLIEAKISFIHVSFPSLNRETYQCIMKGSSFETVLGHLKYLSSVKPEELVVELAFTEQAENVGEVEKVKAFAGELGFGFQHNVLHTRGGHLNHGKSRMSAPDVCAVFARNHFITSEGDITACCHDLQGKTVLGNIKEISFNELLKIKKSRIIANRWFGLCTKCDDINRFKNLEIS